MFCQCWQVQGLSPLFEAASRCPKFEVLALRLSLEGAVRHGLLERRLDSGAAHGRAGRKHDAEAGGLRWSTM